MANRPSPKKLRIGVMLEEVQFSDVVGMDIFGNLSKEYMNEVKQFDVNGSLAQFEDYAMDIEFLFLATALEPARVTPGLRVVPTVTYDDCPRDLDIVIIGGPLLSHRPPQADKFMKEAWTKTRVWMTTCIGSIWLASSGVLEGKTCTCNREFLEGARKLYPGVNWLDQRWVVEDKPYDGEGKGELWTGGGAGAGLHMIITYCLENFDPKFVDTMALKGLDFRLNGNAGQFYID